MTRTQRLTLAAAIVGSAVASVDATIVNVALPSIEHDLGGGLADQQWVSNAYLLALGSLILIGGSLGDIYGERRVFSLGVALFGVFSVATALAPTIGFLIAARALQGVAAALLTPASLAVIVSAFPDRERAPAIGTWLAWGTVGTIVGPLAGGAIVDRFDWRWVFGLNVPLVLATLLLVRAGIARGEPGETRRVDYRGAALCALGLGGIVYALIEQPRNGWGSVHTLGPLVGGALLLVAFVLFERRTPEPMLKLELFQRRNFTVGNIQTFSMYGGLGAVFFFLVIFLQQVAGYTALEAGLATLPSTVVMFLLSRRVGALATRFGPRLFMGGGPLIAAAGLLLLLRLDMHVSYAYDLVPALTLFSVGLSLTVAPLVDAVLADANDSDAGIASAVNNAIARIAALVAVSGVGIVVSGKLVGDSFARNSGSVTAFHEVVLLCAIVIAAGGVIGAIGIRNPERAARAPAS
jgi:EmrB/QacA subfamily drug resistance transporter